MAKFRSAFTVRTLLLGVVSWLTPFVFSFLFFDRNGDLTIAQPLFKSIMIVVFGGVGAGLLALAFERVPPNAAAGFALGMFWLVINLGLDLAVLLPMTAQPFAEYAADIGLRYLLIPIFAVSIGIVADRAAARRV